MDNEAPEQMRMGGMLGDGVMFYQNTSQCCRCCCCQPNIDWTIHDYVNDWSHESHLPVKMFVKEESSWCGRCMSFAWPGWRATKYSVRDGESKTGPVLFTHEKEATCSHCPIVMLSDNGPVRCPCCCCLPFLTTKDASGNVLGTTKYVCDACLFVPKYDVFDKNNAHVYRIRPDTCICGMCVKCRCGGGTKGKCFRIPFPIRKPEPPFDSIGDAGITDLWAGMKHECCTNREMYSIRFPKGGNNAEDMKKVLIGSALLVDITLNEQDQ